jgi:PBP1b-binding outer membrane lipoprotein LpoB
VFRFILVLSMIAVLVGCAQSEIILKNPATGAIKECSKNSGPSFFPIAQTMIDNSAARSCAAGYQAAGFNRMN